MTSKEMESRSGVPRANIRYYEAEGLLTPNREKNGYRDYSEEDLAVLEKIKLLRRLGVSVEELKALCAGETELAPVLDRRLAELQGERETLERVQQVCGDLRSSGATFATLDAGKYLTALDEGPSAPALPRADRIPPVCSIPRRLFARTFDELLVLMLVFVIVSLAGSNPGRLSGNGMGILFQLLILFVEPLVISLLGTTPGKALLGLRLLDADGRRLSYEEALTRHLKMLWHGLGIGIPIWSLVQMYRTVNRCAQEEYQPWDENVTYLAKPIGAKHWVGLVLAAAVMLGGAEAVNCATQLPRNRGDLTVAEFAENFNEQADYMGMEFDYTLNEDGRWSKLPEQTGVVVFDVDGSFGEGEQFDYTVENGKLTAVTLSAAAEDMEGWSSLPTDRMIAAVMAFTWAQKNTPFATGPRREILAQMEELAMEGYTLRQAGTVISLEVEHSGFYASSDLGMLFPEEGINNSLSFTFTVALEE